MVSCVMDFRVYSAIGQEVTTTPKYATLSIEVEPLTTISASFKRLSTVVGVFFLCTMLL